MVPEGDGVALLSDLRSIYLGRRTAVVEVAAAGGGAARATMLYLRDGELYLDRADPLALGVGERLADPAVRAQPESDPDLRDKATVLARTLADRKGLVRDRPAGAVELIGPLPTVHLLLELAVCERDEPMLLRELGGGQSRVARRDDTPALEQLRGLDPDMAQMLMCLERPDMVEKLVEGANLDRLAALRALARLYAVGLAAVEKAPSPGDEAAGRVPPRTLQRFLHTISASLSSMTIDLDVGEHRARIARLWRGLGDRDHYQLLEIDDRADSDEVAAAFGRLARVVHPDHAPKLGFADTILQVLFERAVAAYLTLTDANRRIHYNALIGHEVRVDVDDSQRAEEKKAFAAQSYRRATALIKDQELSPAIDLLKEAARLHPLPRYFALLGRAQARNPSWFHEAAKNLERAVELEPNDAGYRVSLGEVLEKMGQSTVARQQIEKALALQPDLREARKARDRLG